jgi:hypothetical protein
MHYDLDQQSRPYDRFKIAYILLLLDCCMCWGIVYPIWMLINKRDWSLLFQIKADRIVRYWCIIHTTPSMVRWYLATMTRGCENWWHYRVRMILWSQKEKLSKINWQQLPCISLVQVHKFGASHCNCNLQSWHRIHNKYRYTIINRISKKFVWSIVMGHYIGSRISK